MSEDADAVRGDDRGTWLDGYGVGQRTSGLRMKALELAITPNSRGTEALRVAGYYLDFLMGRDPLYDELAQLFEQILAAGSDAQVVAFLRIEAARFAKLRRQETAPEEEALKGPRREPAV